MEQDDTVTRIPIKADFGSGITVDQEVAESAARKVAQDSESPEEARLFLDMLGLIPPQPGYEPDTTHRQKLRRDAERIRKKKALVKEARLQKEKARGIDPSEYGE